MLKQLRDAHPADTPKKNVLFLIFNGVSTVGILHIFLTHLVTTNGEETDTIIRLYSLNQWFSTIELSRTPCQSAEMMEDPVCGERKGKV